MKTYTEWLKELNPEYLSEEEDILLWMYAISMLPYIKEEPSCSCPLCRGDNS